MSCSARTNSVTHTTAPSRRHTRRKVASVTSSIGASTRGSRASRVATRFTRRNLAAAGPSVVQRSLDQRGQRLDLGAQRVLRRTVLHDLVVLEPAEDVAQDLQRLLELAGLESAGGGV